MSTITLITTLFSFVTGHWTDICVTLATLGHFFQQKTIVAKLGTIADNAKNSPPSVATFDKIVNDYTNLNR